MKIRDNNIKSTTTVAMALIIMSMLILPVSATAPELHTSSITEQGEKLAASHNKMPLIRESTVPVSGISLPKNAINTPDGGYVTIPRTMDESGKNLNVKYYVGVENFTKIGPNSTGFPACRGPSTGLYQEGADWTTTANAQTIGYEDSWTMPSSGTISGSNGFYYNPVNFQYPISSPNYDFFQVDWGVGSGVVDNWIMTYSYIDSHGVRQYPYTALSSVPNSYGSTYKVDAMVEPYPLANPSAYVVQVTVGGTGYVYSHALGYTPSLDSVYHFQSYQDQWTTGTGSYYYGADTSASPKVVKDSSGTLTYDGTLVTGKTQWDTLNTAATPSSTRDILSPSSISSTSFSDPLDCNTWR